MNNYTEPNKNENKSDSIEGNIINSEKAEDKQKNYYKDLNYEGQRTNEIKNMTFNEQSRKENNENNFNINDDNNGENESNKDLNEYYFISDIIPPLNFTQKLRDIKIKYQNLKEEIEFLKKENKKYNSGFYIKKY